MTLEALLGALVLSVLGVLVTMLFKRRNGHTEPVDVEALIRTTADALARAIVEAQRGSAGSLAPAHWENFFHGIERTQSEQLRGQGTTHEKLDKLTDLQSALLGRIDRLCDAVNDSR